MEKVLKKDTLYLSADVFEAKEYKGKGKTTRYKVTAQNNVRIYKTDLQGRASSMSYCSEKDTIYFYDNPIFWSKDSQVTAETAQKQSHSEDGVTP